MATVAAGLVKDLREKTGAGMMDCKNALSETEGDIEASARRSSRSSTSMACSTIGSSPR